MVIDSIKLLPELLLTDLPKSEYSIVNSAWLAMMGLRLNGDLDMVITKALWMSRFSDIPQDQSFGLPGPHARRIRIHPLIGGVYMQQCQSREPDDLISKNSVKVNGVNFIEPRYYFRYKMWRHQKLSADVGLLPWWRRTGLTAGKYQKTIKKLKKDTDDIKLLKGFFSNRRHQTNSWKFMSSLQWGVEEVLGYDMSCLTWK